MEECPDAKGWPHFKGPDLCDDFSLSIDCFCSMPKRRAPKRPLVEINKEVRVKDSTHLSVVSYNLLAQDLIETNKHLYTHCPPEQLEWDFRKDNLISDLTQSSADVRV